MLHVVMKFAYTWLCAGGPLAKIYSWQEDWSVLVIYQGVEGKQRVFPLLANLLSLYV